MATRRSCAGDDLHRRAGNLHPRRVGYQTVKTDIEIVGVVRDLSYRNLREQSEQAFFPFDGDSPAGMFYVRVCGTPAAALASIRRAVGRVDPLLPLLSVRTMDEAVDRSLTTDRMLATLSGGFGAVALLLSVVGLYGVMTVSFGVPPFHLSRSKGG